MKCMLRSAFLKSKGLYTVEGAFTIVIFTVLIMMLLSMMTVVQAEMEVQNALDQVAMKFSEYAYLVGDEVEISSDESTTLKTILQDVKREVLSNSLGSEVCGLAIRDLVDEKKLNLVVNGVDGIDFEGTSILGDGRTIKVQANYSIKVDAFGFVDKKLNIVQKSQTKAWLPYYSDTLSPVPVSGGKGSIWNDTNFARGQYFVNEQKAQYKENEVKPGQGIDLYFDDVGKAVEIYSLNIFNGTYSKSSGDKSNPTSYKLNEEEVMDQLDEYIRAFKKDIRNCDGKIEMASGAETRLTVNYKEMILVVPVETKDNEKINAKLEDICKAAGEKDKIEIKIVYSEEAL